jgi:hypothetical protein
MRFDKDGSSIEWGDNNEKRGVENAVEILINAAPHVWLVENSFTAAMNTGPFTVEIFVDYELRTSKRYYNYRIYNDTSIRGSYKKDLTIPCPNGFWDTESLWEPKWREIHIL